MSAGDCPRCGMKIKVEAVSRRKHVMICDECGRAEAIEDYLKWRDGTEGLALRDWYIVKIWQGTNER